MATTPQKVTYYQKWAFRVEIEKINVAGFTKAGPLESPIKVVKQYEGGVNGPSDISTSTVEYGDITLERGGSNNSELYNWWDNLRNGNQDRRNVSIVAQDGAGNELARWNVEKCVISKYVAGDWDRKEEETNIMESVVLTPTKWSKVK